MLFCCFHIVLIMSDTENVMVFEDLPNEIIRECFEYLNGFHSFYSFDGLNSRFYNLIRSVRLYIDFEDVNKTMFDTLCAKMLIDSNIRDQIYSIEILNNDQCFQCNLFFSSFPPNKFLNLQRFIWTPPSLWDRQDSLEHHISYYSGSKIDYNNMYLKIQQSDLPLSKLRALSILNFDSLISNIHQTSSIINLMISEFHLKDSECLFSNLPMLKYLHIKSVDTPLFGDIYSISSNHPHSFHLKQLIIDQFYDKFENFEKFVKQIPNLKSLTFISDDNNDRNIIDAYRWEHLIISSLPKLNTFNFKHSHKEYDSDFQFEIDQFKQFQSDFWKEQHHWYFEYIQEDNLISYYTIPYICDTYQINRNFTSSSNNLGNILVNVKNLILAYEGLLENAKYFFPNVTSLTLTSTYFKTLPTTEHIQYLKMMIKLFKLKHLGIPDNKNVDASFLLEIFEQTPQLSSISLSPSYLQQILNNKGIFDYLTKAIKNFNLIQDENRIDQHFKMKDFCKMFPNIEHLQCMIADTKDSFVIIDNLPKLCTLKIKLGGDIEPEKEFLDFKNEASKMGIAYDMSFYDDTANLHPRAIVHQWFVTTVFIWINNKHTL